MAKEQHTTRAAIIREIVLNALEGEAKPKRIRAAAMPRD
jgi:hypothetical protein